MRPSEGWKNGEEERTGEGDGKKLLPWLGRDSERRERSRGDGWGGAAGASGVCCFWFRLPTSRLGASGVEDRPASSSATQRLSLGKAGSRFYMCCCPFIFPLIFLLVISCNDSPTCITVEAQV